MISSAAENDLTVQWRKFPIESIVVVIIIYLFTIDL